MAHKSEYASSFLGLEFSGLDQQQVEEAEEHQMWFRLRKNQQYREWFWFYQYQED
jgi:hypothetical protein